MMNPVSPNAANPSPPEKSALYFRPVIWVLGFFSFVTVLAYHNLTDGDLWAKMMLGASVWWRGDILRHDLFAFTPVLPQYIDHEWASGFVFYTLLQWFGPPALMLLKMGLACGALFFSILAARRGGSGSSAIWLLLPVAAAALLPGYVPVVRSHAFTYFFFALTLFGLEEIRRGSRWPVFALPSLMLLWANAHGGFVAGLGAMGVYAAFAIFTQQPAKRLIGICLGSFLVSFANPYGWEYWRYLLPALLHPRPDITEWQALSLWANDAFLGFRIFFVVVILVLILGWKKTPRSSWPGLCMLALTAWLGWKSRRHAPFFAVAALALATPFLQTLLIQLRAKLPAVASQKCKPVFAFLALYGAIAMLVSTRFLPGASFWPLSPVGSYPVRETDILMFAQAEGNLAVPFGWGGYAAWRLYPRIKVSIDSRYETAYPETTYQMNKDFFYKQGADWDRLRRDFSVDYIILDWRATALRPADLAAHGYVPIWQTGQFAALFAKKEKAAQLEKTAQELPPTTIEPLDAAIPRTWWP